MKQNSLARRVLDAAVCLVLAAALGLMGVPAVLFGTLGSGPAAAWAQTGETFEEGGLRYQVIADGAVQVGAGGIGDGFAGTPSQALSIPATVTHAGASYKVTKVATYAFRGTAISSLSLAEGLETIGTYAFALCRNLKSVKIPASVTQLYEGSFFGCDALASCTIAAGSKLTSIGAYAFGMVSESDNQLNTGSGEGVLQSFTVPASVDSIGSYAFYHQGKMTSLTFQAESMSYIKAYAFGYCSSLTRLDIPALTGSPYKLWGGVFAGCSSLKVLTYAGNMDTNRYSSGNFSGGYPQTVVYYDKSDQYVAPDNDELGATNHVLPAEVDVYFSVNYYASQADALAGRNRMGSVQVLRGTPFYQISSGAFEASNAVFSGKALAGSWAFEGSPAATDGIAETLYAYAVDEADLAGGSLALAGEAQDDGSFSFTYRGAPVDLGLEVYSASGALLQQGRDYALSISGPAGAASADALEASGSYRLTVTGAGSYRGALSASFAIGTHTPAWLEVTGSGAAGLAAGASVNSYAPAGNRVVATGPSVYEDPEEESPYDKTEWAVVTSLESPELAAAAAGLAGALRAPVLLTSPVELSTACRNEIIRIGATKVVLVGGTAFASAAVETALKGMASVGVLNVWRITGSAAAEVSQKVLALGGGATIGAEFGADCVVVAAGDSAGCLLGASYAYANAAPIMVVEGGVLSSGQLNALDDAGCTRAVLVGSAGALGAGVQAALQGNGQQVSSVEGGSASELSIALARWALAEGTLSAASVTVANGDELAFLGAAPTVSGSRGGLLLLSNGGTDYLDLVSYVASLRYEVLEGQFVGNFVAPSLKQRLFAIWDASIDSSKVVDAAVTVKKDSNAVSFKAVSKSYAASKATKALAKSQSFKLGASCLEGAKLAFKKVSGNAKVTVASGGKVTVKKGLKKGTYKVRVSCTAAATASYAKTTVTKVVTIKVK